MTALDDCFLHDRDRLRHEEALELLRELRPVVGTETVALGEALHRVLAADIAAPFDVPGRTNAAVDGYAFAHDGPTDVPVSARVAAGMQPSPLEPGTAARIFTGAPVPQGADSVAMQEDCEARDGHVTLPQVRRGANVRQRGEDVRAGTLVLAKGHWLDATGIATLASLGTEEVPVHACLRVALFSTGDELRAAETDAVRDANRPMIAALAERLPVRITDGGILPDDRHAVREALSDASRLHDLVLTTGGASRGEEDHVVAVLDEIGRRRAWQIAVKPGRPLTFGRIGDAAFLGLPGNPVAAFVCFVLYARPTILRLAGSSWSEPERYPLPAGFSMTSKPDRREFLRGRIVGGRAVKYPRDGSGLISSLRESSGLIEVPEEVTQVREGDPLSFIPFSALA